MKEKEENIFNFDDAQWRYIERDGEKFICFDDGELIKEELGEIMEDRDNVVVEFYMKKYE